MNATAPPPQDLKEKAIARLRQALDEAESEGVYGQVGVVIEFQAGIPARIRKFEDTTEK